MNQSLQTFRAAPQAWDINAPHPGVEIQHDTHGLIDQFPVIAADNSTTIHHKSEYIVLNAIGSSELANGKYLYSPATGRIEVRWIPGIGSENAAAPQAQLMATVINGILSRKLPWGLVMLGVFLVIAVELLGIRSLSLAVGAYLSIGTTLAIFTGGVVRCAGGRGGQARRRCGRRGDVSPGSLYASGLDRRRRHHGPARRRPARLRNHLQQVQPHRLAAHLPLQPVGVGHGLRAAGVFAVLLRAQAAEEVI